MGSDKFIVFGQVADCRGDMENKINEKYDSRLGMASSRAVGPGPDNSAGGTWAFPHHGPRVTMLHLASHIVT